MSKTYEKSNQFVMIDIDHIEVSEPLDLKKIVDGSQYQFHNPRRRDSKDSGFSLQLMEDLYSSIIDNGLQQPLLCRRLDGNRIQLIAGERRFRCIKKILKTEKKVFDQATESWKHPKEVYSKVPCALKESCDDLVALTLAMDENDNSAPLSNADHVTQVEYLIACGKPPKEIEKLLRKNAAWVNHMINFRKNLPKQAFGALMSGEIPLHTATKLLEYPEERRNEIWEVSAKLLQLKIKEVKETLQNKLEEARTQVEIAQANVDIAKEFGKKPKVESFTAELEKAKEKETVVETKLKEVETETTVTGSMIADAAEKLDATPKTPRAFNKAKIEEHYIEPLWKGIEAEEIVDEVTGQKIDKDTLGLAMAIAEGIAMQKKDVVAVIREFKIEIGEWKKAK